MIAKHRASAAAGLLLVALAACTTTPSAGVQAVPEIRPGVPAGYLQAGELPDSLALVPVVPAGDSAVYANDVAVSHAALALRDTPRWQQAISDADLSFPHAASSFSCALGLPVDEARSPALYRLLRRSFMDAALSTNAAKNKYQRVRPFMRNEQPLCTPADETALRGNGSYPSGHTAIGWMWGLVLTQVDPQHTDALLARARAFGESRLVCNVHWQSDVWQGRNMATATFARLQSNPSYQADVAAARIEVSRLHQQHAVPEHDCAAEASALSMAIQGVQ
ncbi:hypothetical protein ABB29_01255 [Pseudoxanthomonas dokdonensis]|uniref:Acid phosphatase n=2 Tax=Pseudoxanthomonas dokdonensis TaxID=344882 RepID=A0A0R0CQC3_9GAMM|nr:hypothetical protein ABB29_15905 [Pseudoxanthomonas dokdonensis]KRG72105.1 hypothetical protein ABB29_01255 [Pseudoxanthomonas dokdonensis]